MMVMSRAALLLVVLASLCGAVKLEQTSAGTSSINTTPVEQVTAQSARHNAPQILANETVAGRRSLSGGGGQLVFPDQRRRQQPPEGRHAVRGTSGLLWHQLLVGTAPADRYTPAISRAACQLYPDAGSCSGDVTAWYWDSAEEKCRTFRYGGCKGNGNNFITENECRSVCDIGYRQKVTGSSQFLPRPASTAHRLRPDGSGHFSPSPGDVSYRPGPSNYPSRPGPSNYPSRSGPNDYVASAGAGAGGSSLYSDGYRPAAPAAGQVQLQEIGDVDLSGLTSPAGRPGPLAERPPGCSAAEPVCDYDHDDYPRVTVDSIVGRYSAELRQMYQQLYQYPPERFHWHENVTRDDLRSRSAAESVSARHGPGEFICESEVRYSRPGWARSFTAGWQLVINTAAYPQAVRTERCRYEGRRCNYLAPCMSSVCVQRFAVVKMLCASPLNPFVRPRVQDVEIPSGCSCYVTGGSGDTWRQPWVRSGAGYTADHD